MTDLEHRVEAIEERNARVTYDKAWEVSKTRRVLIALVLYVSTYFTLDTIGHEDAWKHAFVPVIAYLISTFSLPPIKRIRLKQRVKRGLKNVTIH